MTVGSHGRGGIIHQRPQGSGSSGARQRRESALAVPAPRVSPHESQRWAQPLRPGEVASQELHTPSEATRRASEAHSLLLKPLAILTPTMHSFPHSAHTAHNEQTNHTSLPTCLCRKTRRLGIQAVFILSTIISWFLRFDAYRAEGGGLPEK
jgi:hypothetical protein